MSDTVQFRPLSPLIDPEASAAERAIYFCGGARAVARYLQVSPQTVWKWGRTKKIPAEYVIRLERLSEGFLTRHQLRPDLYPEDSAPLQTTATGMVAVEGGA